MLCALALHVLIAHALRVLYARARLWLCGLARLCVFFRLLVACAVVLLSSSAHLLAPASSSPYGDYASEHMQDYYNRLEGVKK